MTTEERIQMDWIKRYSDLRYSGNMIESISQLVKEIKEDEAARNKENAIEQQKEIERLKAEIESWKDYKENIDQALNSGDGVYRP